MGDGVGRDRTVAVTAVFALVAINATVVVGCARKLATSEAHDAGVVACPPEEALLRAAADHGAKLPRPPLPDGGAQPDPGGRVVVLFGLPDGGPCPQCRPDPRVSLGITAPVVNGAWTLEADGGISRTDPPLKTAQDYERLAFEEQTRLMLVQVCGNPAGAQVVTAVPMRVTHFTMKAGDGGWVVSDLVSLEE